ncbi:MAG: hypothetical protein GF400_05885 [Candidatus Eisenbacteria bacterium]|nr:hypothetical protein [Candidatus Eisenbacteria bacterium]
MSRTVLTVAGLACVLALASCSTKCEYVGRAIERARDEAQLRDYESAHAILDSAMERAPDDVRLPLEKADIYERAHRFESARAWYEEARKLEPRNVEVVVGAWRSAFEAAGDDGAAVKDEPAGEDAAGEGKRGAAQRKPAADEVAEAIMSEAESLLSAAPDSLFNLMAYVRAHYVLGLEQEAEEEATRLKELYPDSEFASELIKEDLDWIGVERDDDTRLTMADEFLEDYPTTKWRPRAFRLKLVSLRRLGRHDDVLAAARKWAAEHADDPEVLGVAAAAMVESERAPDEAAGLARRAIELSVTAERDKDVPAYYLTLARALLLTRDCVSAMEAAEDGLALLDTGPEEEETGAAWHYVEGRGLECLGRHEEALDAYLRSVSLGGRQNRWPARADTVLRALYEAEFAARAGGVALMEFARERAEYGGPVFADVTDEAGLGGRRESRVAWGDFDGDGYEDLLLSGRVLMRNGGDGTFEDVTEAAGIGGTGANGGVWADVDNDGDLDFYATSGATSGDRTDRLWRNDGDGTFTDVTERAGNVTDHYTTEGAAWGDIDGDGWVDLYLASYERPRSDTFTEYGAGYPDILYRNEKHGTFEDVTTEMGIVPPFGEHLSGRGVNWGDCDNDGDLDIYVSNYRLQENLLWRNEGGERFSNVAPVLGVSGRETDGWWGHTIGSAWGDYDNDGDLDLVCANLAHPRYIEVSDKSMLYRNMFRSDGAFPDEDAFRERRADSGIKYAETHSDPSWGDVDNDGDLDLFITSIYPDCASFLYVNDGTGDFRDVTWLAGARTFNGWGAAMCDYDRDGDLDMAAGSASGLRLLRNEGTVTERQGGSRHWLEVRCQGSLSNATCIGARVTVRSGGRTQIREISGGKGTTSQPSMIAHFGLGGRDDPVSVEVRFPRGQKVVLEDVDPDQIVTVVEPG